MLAAKELSESRPSDSLAHGCLTGAMPSSGFAEGRDGPSIGASTGIFSLLHTNEPDESLTIS